MQSEYQSRLDQLSKALRLEYADRVLIGPFSDHFFSTKLAGISNKDAMLDHPKRYAALKDSLLRFGFDFALQSGIYPAQWYSILGAKHYKWPGGGLPDDMTFQFVEKEYLLADEYDQFLANPNDFTMRVLWPRMTTGLQPLADMQPFYSIGPDPILLGPALAYEEHVRMLETLKQLAEASQASMQAEADYVDTMQELG